MSPSLQQINESSKNSYTSENDGSKILDIKEQNQSLVTSKQLGLHRFLGSSDRNIKASSAANAMHFVQSDVPDSRCLQFQFQLDQSQTSSSLNSIVALSSMCVLICLQKKII